jgi:transposase
VTNGIFTQWSTKVPGLNFLPLSYQCHLPGRDLITQLKRFLARVQISVGVVANLVKTERLALTVVVTMCQCREVNGKEKKRVANKFCCKVDFSTKKTVNLIQKAYGDAALSRTTIIEWHKRLRKGRESVKNDEGNGRPTTSRTDDNIAAVDKMVREYYNL